MIIPPGPEPVSSIGLAAGGEAYPPTETPPQAEIHSTAAGILRIPLKVPGQIRSHTCGASSGVPVLYCDWDWRRRSRDSTPDVHWTRTGQVLDST